MTAPPKDDRLCCERTGGDAFFSSRGLLPPSVSSTASQGSPAGSAGSAWAGPPEATTTSWFSVFGLVSGSRSNQSKRLMAAASAAVGLGGGGLGAREGGPAWAESGSVPDTFPFLRYSEVLAILSKSLAICGSTAGGGKTMAAAGWMGVKAMKEAWWGGRPMYGEMVGVKPF